MKKWKGEILKQGIGLSNIAEDSTMSVKIN